MRRYYLLLGLLFGLQFSALASVVKSIDVTGLNVISRGTILSHILVETGDKIYPNTTNNIIKSLYKTQLFNDVSVLEEDGVIKIHLLEKPYIFKISVTGYGDNVIEKKQLTRLLKSLSLSEGEIFKEKSLNRVVKNLRRTYKEKGYYLATVIKKVEVDKKNRVLIEIVITENELVRVKSIKISGNKVFSTEDILAEFSIGEADFFLLNFFTEKDHYSRIKLESSLKKVQALYENSGYIDFVVNKVEADISDDKKTVDIIVSLFEGRPYKIGNITFSGDSLYYQESEIIDLLSIKTGDIFSQKNLTKTTQNIVNFYTKKGYAFVDVSPKTGQNSRQKTIDIDIPINLNQRVYINKILIQGNAVTQDEVIRREITQTEGAIYSSEAVKKSVGNLKRLGYFSDVSIQVEKLANAQNKINLIFNVVETKTGNFSIGLSHSDNVGLSTNLGIAEKNFLGSGNTLVVDLIQSKSTKKYSFSFINPHFNEKGHSVNYGLTYHTVDASDINASDYQISSISGHMGYGISLSDTAKINATFSTAKHKITCGADFLALEPTLFNKQCEDAKETKINIAWAENTLNNFYNPSDGQHISASFDLALPIGDVKYSKFDVSHDYYTTISKRLVFKANYSFGLAKGYGDEELPFYRRYHTGGQSSVRGFAFNTIGDKYSNGNSIGGEASMGGHIALIAPIPFVRDSKNMRVSVFIDSGNIYKKISDISFSKNRSSYGVGFSWITLIGPIGISYAKPINKEDNDRLDAFNFNIGTNF